MMLGISTNEALLRVLFFGAWRFYIFPAGRGSFLCGVAQQTVDCFSITSASRWRGSNRNRRSVGAVSEENFIESVVGRKMGGRTSLSSSARHKTVGFSFLRLVFLPMYSEVKKRHYRW